MALPTACLPPLARELPPRDRAQVNEFVRCSERGEYLYVHIGRDGTEEEFS
jgi:hypothetical protein